MQDFFLFVLSYSRLKCLLRLVSVMPEWKTPLALRGKEDFFYPPNINSELHPLSDSTSRLGTNVWKSHHFRPARRQEGNVRMRDPCGHTNAQDVTVGPTATEEEPGGVRGSFVTVNPDSEAAVKWAEGLPRKSGTPRRRDVMGLRTLEESSTVSLVKRQQEATNLLRLDGDAPRLQRLKSTICHGLLNAV